MTADLSKKAPQSGSQKKRTVGVGLEAMPPDHIAPMTCYLATDQAWNINGQIFLVYGGTVDLLAHPLPQRTIFKDAMWTVEELMEMVPEMMEGIANPAPPPEDLEVPGRPKSEAQAAS